MAYIIPELRVLVRDAGGLGARGVGGGGEAAVVGLERGDAGVELGELLLGERAPLVDLERVLALPAPIVSHRRSDDELLTRVFCCAHWEHSALPSHLSLLRLVVSERGGRRGRAHRLRQTSQALDTCGVWRPWAGSPTSDAARARFWGEDMDIGLVAWG